VDATVADALQHVANAASAFPRDPHPRRNSTISPPPDDIASPLCPDFAPPTSPRNSSITPAFKGSVTCAELLQAARAHQALIMQCGNDHKNGDDALLTESLAQLEMSGAQLVHLCELQAQQLKDGPSIDDTNAPSLPTGINHNNGDAKCKPRFRRRSLEKIPSPAE